MPDSFDSLDAIEKHFGKLKKAAGEDAEALKALTLEEREAKADFRDQQADRKALELHRRELLNGSDFSDEAKELVQGSTVEELDASFAKVKAVVDKARVGANDEAAAKLYGDPIRPGGGAPPPPRTSDDEKFLADFGQRFNNKEPVTRAEIDRYVQILGGAHLAMGLAKNSQHFDRRGVGVRQVEAALEGKK